jgi:hypothetical protein
MTQIGTRPYRSMAWQLVTGAQTRTGLSYCPLRLQDICRCRQSRSSLEFPLVLRSLVFDTDSYEHPSKNRLFYGTMELSPLWRHLDASCGGIFMEQRAGKFLFRANEPVHFRNVDDFIHNSGCGFLSSSLVVTMVHASTGDFTDLHMLL